MVIPKGTKVHNIWYHGSGLLYHGFCCRWSITIIRQHNRRHLWVFPPSGWGGRSLDSDAFPLPCSMEATVRLQAVAARGFLVRCTTRVTWTAINCAFNDPSPHITRCCHHTSRRLHNLADPHDGYHSRFLCANQNTIPACISYSSKCGSFLSGTRSSNVYFPIRVWATSQSQAVLWWMFCAGYAWTWAVCVHMHTWTHLHVHGILEKGILPPCQQ